MKKVSRSGFTIIELLVVITALTIVIVIAITNVRSIRAENRDENRKTDINALYYQLEALHERNGFYPQQLTETTLKGLNPDNLKDTNGVAIGEAASEYTYTPKGCNDTKCQSYTLEAQLEREADFIKESLNS